MPNPNDKRIWATWSGGVDSTALMSQLLAAGFDVHPIVVLFGPAAMRRNEMIARAEINEYFATRYPDSWHKPVHVPGDFLNVFSSDGGREVLRRNKHIMDYVMMNHVIPDDVYYIGTGTYVGADTSAVDHLHGMDTDSRYLSAYLLSEYGLGYQHMSLGDFGTSRYKTDQVAQLIQFLPLNYAFATYNCMTGYDDFPGVHCGVCYKCVERHAAFLREVGADNTPYHTNPRNVPYFKDYLEHFKGNHIHLSWEDIQIGNQGTHKEDGSI